MNADQRRDKFAGFQKVKGKELEAKRHGEGKI
jgi:hypothetical protein